MYGPTSTSSAEGPKTFWENLENAYYGFCDYLEDRGVSVYEWFVNPLEDHGIPSLNAAIVIMLALLVGVTGVAMHASVVSLGIKELGGTNAGVSISPEPTSGLNDAPPGLPDGSQELPPLPPDSTPPASSASPVADNGDQPPALPLG